MASLRCTLFDVLEGLKDGTIEPGQAKAIVATTNAILKSAEVQIEFEKLKLDSLVPGVLPSMALAAPLKQLGSSDPKKA